MSARVTSSFCHSCSSVVFLLPRQWSLVLFRGHTFHCVAAQTVPVWPGAPLDGSCAPLPCRATLWLKQTLSSPRTSQPWSLWVEDGLRGPGPGSGCAHCSEALSGVGRMRTRTRGRTFAHASQLAAAPPVGRLSSVPAASFLSGTPRKRLPEHRPRTRILVHPVSSACGPECGTRSGIVYSLRAQWVHFFRFRSILGVSTIRFVYFPFVRM